MAEPRDDEQERRVALEDFHGIVGEEALDVAAVERENLHPDDGRVPHVPFGFNNANWEDFKAKKTDASELRSFTSPDEDWRQCLGSEGYLWVEDGLIVSCIMTAMN